MCATSRGSHTPKVHNIVLGGPAIVHLLKPIGADTFEDDAQQVFDMSHHKGLLELKSKLWDISPTVLILLLQRGE